MSRVLPILFNTEMVRAILDGRRTVTRRVVKFAEGRNPNWTGYKKDGLILYNGKNEPCNKKPPYQPGDILYVREAYKRNMDGYSGIDFGGYIYKADCSSGFKDLYNPWHPSIHMPKEAARIWLKVTDVRVERLKDITANSAMDEGFTDWNDLVSGWNSTLKKSDIDRYGWDANPWVWVIEFERCEKPKDV